MGLKQYSEPTNPSTLYFRVIPEFFSRLPQSSSSIHSFF